MPQRKNPETSNEAYYSLDPRDMSEIYRQIILALTNIGEGTFEDISAYLKVDKAKIWKRMSELERMNICYRPGNKRVLKSNRMGYTWMLTVAGQPKTENAERLLKGKSISEITKEIKQTIDRPLNQISMF